MLDKIQQIGLLPSCSCTAILSRVMDSLQRAAALGPVYGRAADADASGDLLIAGAD
jgi:hypothetical protein